jgi:hypothetical protein
MFFFAIKKTVILNFKDDKVTKIMFSGAFGM